MKNKRMLLLTGIPIALITSSIVGIGVSAGVNNDGATNGQNTVAENIFKEYKSDPTNITGMSYYTSKIVKDNVPRKINNDFYSTNLTQKYNNFVYPGYNCNYETIWNWLNGKDNQLPEINNKKEEFKKAYYAVLDEKVADTELTDWKENWKPRYNDGRWIKQQISAGTFKKHPAAANFYNPNLFCLDKTPAVQKDFKISTARMGYYPLGLFAPAGEEITITFSSEMMKQMEAAGWQDYFVKFNFNRNYSADFNKYKIEDSGRISNSYPWLANEMTFSFDEIKEAKGVVKIGSPFGGSLGITINSRISTENGIQPIKFSVSGAIEEVMYVDGFTTEVDWKNQIDKLMKGKITGPQIGFDSYYLAGHLPMNTLNEYELTKKSIPTTNKPTVTPITDEVQRRKQITVGYYENGMNWGYEVADFEYPQLIIQKWGQLFYYATYLMNQKDPNNKYVWLFTQDIWDYVKAWGGAYYVFVPPIHAVEGLFKGVDSFTMAKNELLMHESCHGLGGNDSWGFKKKTHDTTNQLYTAGYSILNDVARFRNKINWKGERGGHVDDVSDRSTSFTSINMDVTIASDAAYPWCGFSEWGLYSDILYQVGIRGWTKWIMTDQVMKPEERYGLNELKILSELFNLNYYNAIAPYYSFNDGWPETQAKANPAEAKVLKQINKYPSFDFMGNLYAVGQYLYDYKKNSYVYTSDNAPAFEIPAGIQKYKFEFDKYINSRNKKFTWTDIMFDKKTKSGGTLERDPSNPKHLIYTPNPDKIDEIDEFDITIKPGEWENKPNKYVPGYRWKIKVRQVVNRPVCEANYHWNDQGDVNSISPVWNESSIYSNVADGLKNATIKFNFVNSSKTANEYYIKTSQKINIKVNGTSAPATEFTNSETDKGFYYHFNATSNKIIPIEITYAGEKEAKDNPVEFYDGTTKKKINWIEDYSLSPYVNSLTNKNNKKYLSDKIFDYSPRWIPHNGTGDWGTYVFPKTYLKELGWVDPKTYKFSDFDIEGWQSSWGGVYNSTVKEKDLEKLNNNKEGIWLNNPTTDNGWIKLKTSFNNPVNIKSIFIGGGVGITSQVTPQGIKAKLYDNAGNLIKVLEDNKSNLGGDYINLDQLQKVNGNTYVYTLDEVCKNVSKIEWEFKKRGNQFALNYIGFSQKASPSFISNVILNDSPIYDFRYKTPNTSFGADSNWEAKQNTFEGHCSLYNQGFIQNKSGVSSASLNFSFFGSGFTLLGEGKGIPKNFLANNVELKIDGKVINFNSLIEENKMAVTGITDQYVDLENQNILTWVDYSKVSKEHQVSITFKNIAAMTLMIDALGLYGDDAYIVPKTS